MRKPIFLLLAVVGVVLINACTDKLNGSKSCPLLCPEQATALIDTTIEPSISIDTTVSGLPPIGSEAFLMLSSHGDTVQTRAIIRFDTLPTTFSVAGTDSNITVIDSAMLVVPILKPDTNVFPSGPITIEAYDVDTTVDDTVSATLGSLFRPDRFLGSRTFTPDSVTDTLRIPINTDTVLAHIDSGARFRVGLRLVPPTGRGYDLRIGTSEIGSPVNLRIIASLDTNATAVSVAPISNSPPNQTFLSGPLADYTIVLAGGTTTPPTLLGVSGLPSRRVFIQFNVPSRIVDSTTIVRATLELTQAPNRRVGATDSAFIYPLAIVAQPTVTDIASQLEFLGPPGQVGLDSLRMAPGDSGLRSFQIVGLTRTWKAQPLSVSPRTLALRSGVEGQLPGEFDFFSTSAPLAVRPRLRITYVPASNFGVP